MYYLLRSAHRNHRSTNLTTHSHFFVQLKQNIIGLYLFIDLWNIFSWIILSPDLDFYLGFLVLHVCKCSGALILAILFFIFVREYFARSDPRFLLYIGIPQPDGTPVHFGRRSANIWIENLVHWTKARHRIACPDWNFYF